MLYNLKFGRKLFYRFSPPPRAKLDAVLGLSSPRLSEMKPTGSSPLYDPVMAGGWCTPKHCSSPGFLLNSFRLFMEWSLTWTKGRTRGVLTTLYWMCLYIGNTQLYICNKHEFIGSTYHCRKGTVTTYVPGWQHKPFLQNIIRARMSPRLPRSTQDEPTNTLWQVS